jgi:hypothetical protein
MPAKHITRIRVYRNTDQHVTFYYDIKKQFVNKF